MLHFYYGSNNLDLLRKSFIMASQIGVQISQLMSSKQAKLSLESIVLKSVTLLPAPQIGQSLEPSIPGTF